ncbi:hypothetical protein, partial [Methanosarcina sp.]|uniref:hypothetical protein n=1 Tax=Methanosarcina sp. TaxID=2213 RepID=UPI002AB92A33
IPYLKEGVFVTLCAPVVINMKADLRITSTKKSQGTEAIRILVSSKTSIGSSAILFSQFPRA